MDSAVWVLKKTKPLSTKSEHELTSFLYWRVFISSIHTYSFLINYLHSLLSIFGTVLCDTSVPTSASVEGDASCWGWDRISGMNVISITVIFICIRSSMSSLGVASRLRLLCGFAFSVQMSYLIGWLWPLMLIAALWLRCGIGRSSR